MTPVSKVNSWSRAVTPFSQDLENPPMASNSDSSWRLRILTSADSEIFDKARANPLLRLLAISGKHKAPLLIFGLVLLACAVYFFLAPAGNRVAGFPVQYVSIALAACSVAMAVLVTLGAWLRQLEDVEDAAAILQVPVMAVEKGAKPDVH